MTKTKIIFLSLIIVSGLIFFTSGEITNAINDYTLLSSEIKNNTTNLDSIIEANKVTYIVKNVEKSKKEEQKSNIYTEDKATFSPWWGEIIATTTFVMSEPTEDSKQLGKFSKINTVKVLEEIEDKDASSTNIWYKIDGGAFPGKYIISSSTQKMSQPQAPTNPVVPQEVTEGEYWIDVDLSKKVLTLFRYNKAEFVTYVSIGRSYSPTKSGTYKIWSKFENTRMRGGPPHVPYYYNLANVPYTLYYLGSYAIHGTYWHDEFGKEKSAGCTNLTQGDAEYVFNKVNPIQKDDENFTKANKNNPGTIVYNHY